QKSRINFRIKKQVEPINEKQIIKKVRTHNSGLAQLGL
ncbi:hypothetical protein Q361_1774, partial [Flavobacterium croceum DSM 17960]